MDRPNKTVEATPNGVPHLIVMQMNQQVELHGDLWKLDDIADEVEWIRTQKWTRRTYMRESDHEHCVVCYWTIGG